MAPPMNNLGIVKRNIVRADKAVPYGDVMEVMNAVRSAGYLKIGLVGLEVRDEKK